MIPITWQVNRWAMFCDPRVICDGSTHHKAAA